MIDLNGWPIWAALAVVFLTQMVALLKDPLKNAMPSTIQDWFDQRRQQQMQRYMSSLQKRESQEEISTRLLGYLIDDQNAKLDEVLAAQKSFNVKLSTIEAFTQGVINNGPSDNKTTDPERNREGDNRGAIPHAGTDTKTARAARDAQSTHRPVNNQEDQTE